jgi:DNA polymerase-3 subunit epsilon
MSLRQIILDTETTGLNPKNGDRIIEIGCVELVNRSLTGNNFHCYLNPERDSEAGALDVHGLTREFLADKPKFADIVHDFRRYVADAEILIHNADFDIGFLDAELARLELPRFRDHCGATVIDTLAMAKEMHPGKRNSLDTLCDRYGISNAHRTLHGALLDASLLAEVYLAMTRGQDSLMMDIEPVRVADVDFAAAQSARQVLIVLRASAEETAEHEAWLDSLKIETKAEPIWRRAAEMAATQPSDRADGVQAETPAAVG